MNGGRYTCMANLAIQISLSPYHHKEPLFQSTNNPRYTEGLIGPILQGGASRIPQKSKRTSEITPKTFQKMKMIRQDCKHLPLYSHGFCPYSIRASLIATLT